MIGYKNTLDNKISIFKNMLINNDAVTAYYVLYPYNYHVMDSSSAENHISKLYDALDNLHSSFGEIKLSIFRLKNIISKEDTIKSIIQTVKIYNRDYEDFPDRYKKYIRNIVRDFSILAINIDTKNSIDIENQSLKSIIKSKIDTFVKESFLMNNVAQVDEELISNQNQRIKNILKRYAEPANEKLVMNIYINSLFPSYNLVYNDYLVDHSSTILSSIKQEIIPHLGWFEMSNSGIVDLGGKSRTTYGCVLSILEFPKQIISESFNISFPGLHVNMNLLSKDKAMLKFKRMRADVKEEAEEANTAKASDTDVEDDLSLVQKALHDIRNGRIVTEVDAQILVIADTKEELDERKSYVVSVLSNLNVVCSIASNQAKAYVNSFIKNKPMNYFHAMDLQYALSFQLDNGILIGDQDSKFEAPSIGESM